MLKIRLKQSVIERKARNGPAALRRHERLLDAQRRQHKQQNSLAGSSKYTITDTDDEHNTIFFVCTFA